MSRNLAPLLPDMERPGWPPYRPHRPLAVIGIVLIVLGLLAAVVGFAWPTVVPVPAFGAAPAGTGDTSTAAFTRRPALVFPPGPAPGTPVADVLAALPTVTADTEPPYSRQVRSREFGGWLTDQGCNTRDRILARDAVPGSVDYPRCPTSGQVLDVYTGATLPFDAVEIDHRVALGDAWRTGAQQLTRTERGALANDPRNLVAVSGRENASKSDDPAGTARGEYLPPRDRCGYVRAQLVVKAAYRLGVTAPERRAVLIVLRDCPGLRVG